MGLYVYLKVKHDQATKGRISSRRKQSVTGQDGIVK